MTCNCLTWCRVPEGDNGERYPMSDHHSQCPEFKPERYVRLAVDEEGPWCICTPVEAAMMQEDAEEPYLMRDVMLTPDQVAKMPEFDGF